MKVLLLATMLLAGSSAWAQYASVYTSVSPEDCETIEDSDLKKNPKIDYYKGQCGGVRDYKAIISGGDLRYSLSLKYQDQEITFTDLDQFHGMGANRIEWRGRLNQSGLVIEYTSLIYRLMLATGDGGPNDEKLFVVRLNGASSCLIGVVDRSPNMNKNARAIADDMSAACLPVYK